MDSYTNRLMDRQNERKTGCQAANRWAGCRAGRQTEGLTVGQADSRTDLQTDRLGLRLFNVLISFLS